MIGHQQIIAARKQGMRPSAVFMEVGRDPLPIQYPFQDPERALALKTHPTVYLATSDLKIRPDLRFLAGIRVHLVCDALTDDVLAIAEAIAAAGSPYLIASDCHGVEVIEYKNGEWNAWTS